MRTRTFLVATAVSLQTLNAGAMAGSVDIAATNNDLQMKGRVIATSTTTGGNGMQAVGPVAVAARGGGNVKLMLKDNKVLMDGTVIATSTTTGGNGMQAVGGLAILAAD